jgi:hypothetical protein
VPSVDSTVDVRRFFLLVALALIVSTSLGLWIAFTRPRSKRLTWVLLIAGIVVPLGLLIV